MTNHKQIARLTTQEPKVRLVKSSRQRRRFNPKILISRTIETTVIVSVLLTGFAGVGAIACWGLEIIELNTNPRVIFSSWHYQKNACLGGMLVGFSTFLGSSLLGASLNISRDNFHK